MVASNADKCGLYFRRLQELRRQFDRGEQGMSEKKIEMKIRLPTSLIHHQGASVFSALLNTEQTLLQVNSAIPGA